jgi:hypothetical protein
VLFEPVGEETRISIEHGAWDTIPSATSPGTASPSTSHCNGPPTGGALRDYWVTRQGLGNRPSSSIAFQGPARSA